MVERLQELKRLIKIERDEDFAQYTEHFSRNNIQHRKRNGVTWYPVIISNTEIGIGEYLSIELERTSNHNEPHQFTGGKPAALFSALDASATPLNGTIKVIGPNKVRLQLTVDELPDWCEDGKLGLNLLFDETGYKEMDIALDKVIHSRNNRLAELRDIIYAKKKATFSTLNSTLDLNGLNDSQNKAVQKIIAAQDIAIVHGPPGTGKTTTLVQAIKQILKTEKQVLVCSASNTAVDLMTEKLHHENISVVRLGNPARISEEVLMNTLDAKMMAHPSYKELKNYRKTAEEYFRMAGKYKRTFGREEREQRQLLYQEAKKIVAEARVLEDYIQHEQFANASVIACTLVVAAGRMLRDKQFSTVLIDEAAQALEPMCWIPISRSNRVIFAGDHFQLPPTVKSKLAEAGGLKETLFERCMQLENCSVLLDVQYRMHEHIMNFSNEQFYEGKLKADELVKKRVLSSDSEFDVLTTSLNFIDTAGCGFDEQLNPESLSISNPEEAVLLMKHLTLLLQHYTQNNSSKKISVGIISPYKEQVQYITQLLDANDDLKQLSSKITVKTIDGFQGQERDIIYISLVRSNENKDIGFLADIRRMNVAMTRAKKKLVIMGNSATLANNDFYKKLIDYAESVNGYTSAWEIME
ncbi:MAG: AAA family ATPase [Bacteroidia bacterium]|nr:AAA family ATPase [Bacteroidota bacterium]MBP6413505.1 AAA family ATPase [Bacteroidia bacterium]